MSETQPEDEMISGIEIEVDHTILRYRTEELLKSMDAFAQVKSFELLLGVCASSRALEHAWDGYVNEFDRHPPFSKEIEEALMCANLMPREVREWDGEESFEEQSQIREDIQDSLSGRLSKVRSR